MFWDIQYSNFRIFKDFYLLFSCKFFIQSKVCPPIDRLNIESVRPSVHACAHMFVRAVSCNCIFS